MAVGIVALAVGIVAVAAGVLLLMSACPICKTTFYTEIVTFSMGHATS